MASMISVLSDYDEVIILSSLGEMICTNTISSNVIELLWLDIMCIC